MAQEFSQFTQEKLGHYVYALRDPRNRQIFYIGKGQGNRVFAHANQAIIEDGDALSQKISLIKEIHQAGLEVETFIVRHGISSSHAAYVVESSLIDLLDLLDPKGENSLFSLTNLVKGHDSDLYGCMSTDAIQGIYDVKPCPEISESVILFKIPRLWSPQMTAEELYEATHGWWVLGPRRNKAQYAFAVSAGVIRAIYRIDSWRQRQPGDRGYEPGGKARYGFDGQLTHELDKYINTSVHHLFKRGDRSTARYLNC